MNGPGGGTTRLAAAAFGVLLLATLGAFLLSNRLKASEPDVQVLHRDRSFSPNGDGRNETDTVAFRLKTSGRAAIDVVDADGVRVRRLRDAKRIRRGVPDEVTWDGRDDDGHPAPDGKYRLRFILDGGRALLAPRPFAVDTVAPRASVEVDADTPIIRPGGTAGFTVRGAGEDAAPRFRVVRTDVTPPRTVRTIPGALGKTDYAWDGRTDSGAVAPPGVYLIAVTAYDKARNAGQTPRLPLDSPAHAVAEGRPGVTVRSLAVQPPVRAVRAGGLANLRVDARGRAFRWTLRRLGKRKPVADGRRAAGKTDLLVRVPRGRSGLYLVQVRSHRDTATVPVAVRARDHAGPLVVLPTITWLGRDPVDADKDGVPDVFGSGTAVRFPRLLAYPGGVPPGFHRELAPLLRDLDERGVRYDLVTDLDLALGGAPTEDDAGVLMAGEPTWVSRALAAQLRGYVRAGGRLALFGPRALRATVSVGEGVLARPTPVTPLDALGGRLAPVRTTDKPLSVLAEDRDLGLLEGFSGTLPGFDRVEELLGAGPGAKVTTSIGEEGTALRPVVSAATLGRGLVIRVGLPDWGARLAAGDDPVTQITANVVDLLRGKRPKARTANG